MLTALLLAATPLPVDVVGFSADDKYVAFIDHGVAEGSGYPWARLRVLDVAKNDDAVPPVSVTLESSTDTDTEEGAVKQARAAAQKALTKLHVSAWVAPRVIAFDPKGEMTDHEGAPIGTVKVETHAAKKGTCDDPLRPLLARLTIYFVDDDKPLRFADEKKPPKDRACATSCELGGVFAHGKAALMFTHCQVPGGEGPAQKYSPYAGKLTYGLDEALPPQ